MAEPVAELRCFQCEAVIPAGTPPLSAIVGGVSQPVCCPGCKRAVETVDGMNLEAFYEYRDRSEAPAADHCCGKQQRQAVDFADSVTAHGSGQRLSVIVPDIRCAACTWLIENGLSQLDGVTACRVSLSDKRVMVDFSGRDPAEIVEFIEQLGYTVHPDRAAETREAIVAERKHLLSRLGVAGIGMMQVMMFALASYVAGEGGIEPAYESLMRWASLAIATPVALYSASPFHVGAWRDLMQRSPGMDVPVSLAIMTAWLLSFANTLTGGGEVYFDSVCMFTFFLLIGRYVELRSRQRYQESRNLSESLLPASARLCGDEDRFVAIGAVKPGDRVKVLPGERIPVDGILLAGHTSTNEAPFTGEAAPVDKQPGSTVLAGSENIDGEIEVEVQAGYDEFVITRISELFKESTAYKPRFSMLADRIARHFVTLILLLAAVSALFWYFAGVDNWIAIGLTVLVVSCPCALSLATPVAYTVATSAMRNLGVVISQGAFLERIAGIDRVVFDKTGTLTRGRFRVDAVRRLADMPEGVDPMALAAALERGSKHPLARAFEVAGELRASDVETVPGQGVTGVVDGCRYRLGKPAFATGEFIAPPQGDGIWILLASDKPLTWFCLRDEDRPEARNVIDTIRKRGLSLALLTGDSSAHAPRLAEQLGIGDVFTAMDPEEKSRQIRAWQSSGERVLMVGDGINDTAAMGVADASIAVTPVDVFVQTAADATMVNGNLEVLPAVMAFAGKARRVIRQNVGWAIAYNVCVIPLAVTGSILPWMAALGMSMSSLIVVLNANRLFKA